MRLFCAILCTYTAIFIPFLAGCDILSTMDVLNLLQNTNAVVALLQQRLFSIEQAISLVDNVEGFHPEARRSAVLLPLFELQGKPHLLFIRRAATLRAHSGEIAFPGGKADPEDSSLLHTALREAREEVGIVPEHVVPLGVLPPVFTVMSNYLITPVVGFLPAGLGDLQLQPSEVAEDIIVPLDGLADPAILHTELWGSAQKQRTVYFFDYGTYRIWGATGRILATLLDLLCAQSPQ